MGKSGNWENSKLCVKTFTQLLIFPISTCADI